MINWKGLQLVLVILCSFCLQQFPHWRWFSDVFIYSTLHFKVWGDQVQEFGWSSWFGFGRLFSVLGYWQWPRQQTLLFWWGRTLMFFLFWDLAGWHCCANGPKLLCILWFKWRETCIGTFIMYCKWPKWKGNENIWRTFRCTSATSVQPVTHQYSHIQCWWQHCFCAHVWYWIISIRSVTVLVFKGGPGWGFEG